MDAEPGAGRDPWFDEHSRPRSRPARKAGRPRRRRLWITLLVVLLLLSPAIYSWTQMALLPSSLPLSVRTVEWLRQNHMNWLVDEVEHVYYSLNAPSKGGPQLKTLPAVGLTTAATPARPKKRKVWPPPIKPVFAAPLPGEGRWKPTGPAVNGGPPVLVTTFRTERDYPRIVAYVAWFDHTRTDLAYYPGRYEPPSAALRGPFQVPSSQRWRLLATFNSGFIYADGLNGDALNGRTNEPFKDGNATLIAYKDGRVDILPWTGGPSPGVSIAWARQSLPLIVENGRLSPKLSYGNEWGYTLGNAVRVWRTGAGIDRHGNLIYAAANDQTVFTLARILQRAGAVRAMELDINPEWPSLITYAHHHGIIPTKVVPNPMQSAWRYLVPDDRDFFAVYRRIPGRVTVPLK